MPGPLRTSLILLIAGSVAIGYPATADAQSTPVVIHACYVPLTGTVYRIKEDVDVRVAPPGPLGEHFARELREVARVPGIKVETLAAPHRAELKRALG